MFYFSRRTLWIIIFVTIPLIVLLNTIGQDEAGTPGLAGTRVWSLDTLVIETDQPAPDTSFWTVDLDGSSQLRLTVAQNQIPSQQLDVAIEAAIRSGRQGGRFWVTVVNPLDENAFATSVEFLRAWLPDGDARSVVLSGDLNEELIATAEILLESLQGEGMANLVAPQPSLGRLESPAMGTREQLAFLLFVGVLQQRLSGYDPQVHWDHRARTSQVLINQTLSPTLFDPVTAKELEPVQAAYSASAEQRERNAEQIHRYLVTSAVYGLPPDFLVSQQQRLAAVTLEDVNAVREQKRVERFVNNP
jgi:hypothetical protein